MNRACRALMAGAAVVLTSGAEGAAQQACSPALTIKNPHLSEAQGSTSERRWNAVVSVDAAGCAPNAIGRFELVFSRLKENGPELQFRERLLWGPLSIAVDVAFAADEAVERAWIENVTPCPCAP